jgi:hypothetical protein
MTAHTQILSVHVFRRNARKEERRLQEWLDRNRFSSDAQLATQMRDHGYPSWMHGVRVEKAGRFSFAVVATDTRGH